jgi:two-component system, CitB family, sensor kinase
MKHWSLASRIFVSQLAFLMLLTAGVTTVLFLDARQQAHERAAQRMNSVAVAVADSPFVLEAVTSPEPTARLQPYTERVRRDAGVDFITIMAPDRTRFTHPDPDQIGAEYIGSVDQALAGRPQTEVFAGTLGPSIRAIAPVTDAAGTVRGMVASGVTVSNVSVAVAARLPFVILTALAVMAVSSLASWLLSRYLKRVTLGWGPDQLSRIFVFYETVLHSVREGMLLVDTRGRLVLYNDQAARMLGLPLRSPGAPPADVASLPLPPALKELLLEGSTVHDEVLVTDEHVLLVSQDPAATSLSSTRRPAKAAGEAPSLGAVATLRDHTEVQSLAGELESMRTLRDALRAQTHEHSNRLHTIVSLIELGKDREALEFASRDLQQSQQLTDEVVAAIDEPFISALLVGKAAQANERGIELHITAGPAEGGWTPLPDRPGLDPEALVTIVGNLLDNAFDAVSSCERKEVSIDFLTTADRLWIQVHDSGPGLPDAGSYGIFTLGFSSKGEGGQQRGVGLALVRLAVTRMGGELTADNDEGALFTVSLPLGGPVPSSPGFPGSRHG